MAKKHDKCHDHCEHELRHCLKCDLAYCTKCSKEWGAECTLTHYPCRCGPSLDTVTITPGYRRCKDFVWGDSAADSARLLPPWTNTGVRW